LTDIEKRMMENCIESESIGKVDLEKLKETNPALYRKIMNSCREHGIDQSSGMVDENVI
jgi:hypothetical protein